MKTKIEVEKTYWVGMTQTQLDDCRRFFALLQTNDIQLVMKRETATETPRVIESIEALGHAVVQGIAPAEARASNPFYKDQPGAGNGI